MRAGADFKHNRTYSFPLPHNHLQCHRCGRRHGEKTPPPPPPLPPLPPPPLQGMRGDNENDRGTYLTWEDLWVLASDRQGRHVPILRGLTGYARPGEVLAVMGPSGGGKSTLLDALAGRLGSNVKQRGEILVNGRRQKLAFGTSAYVTQDDVLMATLTIREAVYYSAQLQLPNSMRWQEKRERAEETIREMGLGGATDNRIGGWASKGISGGEKRRVSICLEILKRPKLLFLDEPTSGLDSAASYHVMSRIRRLASLEGMTIVAAVHQPSREVFKLFHSLCLLAYGETVYFGPASTANNFFAMNGFPCPALRNPSDHFLRIINKDFDNDIDGSFKDTEITTTEAIGILINSYKYSVDVRRVARQVEEIRKTGGALVTKSGQPSFIARSIVLTKRSFLNMHRDLGYYWLRFATYFPLCVCIGTIFHNIDHDFGSIQDRSSMLVFVAGFLTFMAIGGFPSFVEDMKIFERERTNGHYGVASFVVANTISSTPYLALISVVPGSMAYFLSGLRRGANHFAYFALALFTCMMLVESLMMIVASIVPDFLMGIITGAGIQGIMMLNGGFFRLPNRLPKPVWRYPMHYIAFHTHAIQGLYKNELSGLTFPNDHATGPPTITGDEILRDIFQVEMAYSNHSSMLYSAPMATSSKSPRRTTSTAPSRPLLHTLDEEEAAAAEAEEILPEDTAGNRSLGGRAGHKELYAGLISQAVFLTWHQELSRGSASGRAAIRKARAGRGRIQAC
uniref:ABC transporter domain-containing protein n=1 Tax=Ananas comosus var. bracteatus TaxID=296719 RepID=A0A6V7PU87_ANACO|nr:unnamed protein product [Ananas comosus var. bracteatus]